MGTADGDVGQDHLLGQRGGQELPDPREQCLCERDEIDGGGEHVAGGTCAAREPARLFNDRATSQVVAMTRGHPTAGADPGRRGGAEPQWLEDPGDQRVVPGAGIEDLDQTPEEAEASVAVVPPLAWLVPGLTPAGLADIAPEAVVAVPGVGELVEVDPARVGEQVR